MLRDEFKKRWLTTNEVYCFLQYIPIMLNSKLINLTLKAPILPESIIIIFIKVVIYSYIKIREIEMMVTSGNVKIIQQHYKSRIQYLK